MIIFFPRVLRKAKLRWTNSPELRCEALPGRHFREVQCEGAWTLELKIHQDFFQEHPRVQCLWRPIWYIKIRAIKPPFGRWSFLIIADLKNVQELSLWVFLLFKLPGTQIDAIMKTEDRELFSQVVDACGEKIAESSCCDSVSDALAAAQRIGYPVLVRAAYALGGLGSGFAYNEENLRQLVTVALVNSPQVIIDKSLTLCDLVLCFFFVCVNSFKPLLRRYLDP